MGYIVGGYGGKYISVGVFVWCGVGMVVFGVLVLFNVGSCVGVDGSRCSNVFDVGCWFVFEV